MPAILPLEAHEPWLMAPPIDAFALLRPYPRELMVAYPVSKRVNTPRNDDPGLIDPIS